MKLLISQLSLINSFCCEFSAGITGHFLKSYYNNPMKKFLFVLVFLLSANITLADTLIFAQVTDVHLPAKTKQPIIKRDYTHSEDNLRCAIRKINSDNNIQYVFFTGDSVDRSYKDLYEKFFGIANYLNKPYYVCLGNHDVNSPGGLNKTETLKIIQKLSRYHQYYPNYCIELNNDFIAIMLDGTNDYVPDTRGYFNKSTLQWLKNVLEENKDKKVIIFQHFPIVEPADGNLYTKLHQVRNKHALISTLKKHGNVKMIVSGHYHKSGEFEKYGIKHYSTSALFEMPYYRIIKIDYEPNGDIKNIESELVKCSK